MAALGDAFVELLPQLGIALHGVEHDLFAVLPEVANREPERPSNATC